MAIAMLGGKPNFVPLILMRLREVMHASHIMTEVVEAKGEPRFVWFERDAGECECTGCRWYRAHEETLREKLTAAPPDEQQAYFDAAFPTHEEEDA